MPASSPVVRLSATSARTSSAVRVPSRSGTTASRSRARPRPSKSDASAAGREVQRHESRWPEAGSIHASRCAGNTVRIGVLSWVRRNGTGPGRRAALPAAPEHRTARTGRVVRRRRTPAVRRDGCRRRPRCGPRHGGRCHRSRRRHQSTHRRSSALRRRRSTMWRRRSRCRHRRHRRRHPRRRHLHPPPPPPSSKQSDVGRVRGAATERADRSLAGHQHAGDPAERVHVAVGDRERGEAVLQCGDAHVEFLLTGGTGRTVSVHDSSRRIDVVVRHCPHRVGGAHPWSGTDLRAAARRRKDGQPDGRDPYRSTDAAPLGDPHTAAMASPRSNRRGATTRTNHEERR